MAGGRVEEQQLESPEAAAARGDDRGDEEMEDQSARLPEDVLAAILLRVPPRWLAVSRCVCRAWRDAVDGRCLLRSDLLPLSLAGLFVHFDEHLFQEFFARPFSSAAGVGPVSGDLSFLPPASPHSGNTYNKEYVHWGLWGKYGIDDHCNGLLLLRCNYVVNPATRWWHTLPRCPPKRVAAGSVIYRPHLVYDPMISPYYDVVMIPTLDYHHHEDEVDPSMEESEWPPSRCKMYVFSSKLGYWEEKYFVREGDAAGTVREMREGFQDSAVYFRGALYVHCRPNFLMRVSLLDNTYRVIKPPKDATEGNFQCQVVRSKKGVYFVSFDTYWPLYKCWLKVWILNESRGQTEWMLKHDKDLKPLLARHRFKERVNWILEDINYNILRSSIYPEGNKKPTSEESIEWNSDGDFAEDMVHHYLLKDINPNIFRSSFYLEGNKKPTSEESTEWNSDDDVEEEYMVDHYLLEDNMKSVIEKEFKWNSNDHNDLSNGDMVKDYFLDEENCRHGYNDVEILGFHPYKEIVFLSASERTGLAYHLNGLKIEELGNIYPKDYIYFKQLSNERERIKSFPYTPCWIEEFHGNN